MKPRQFSACYEPLTTAEMRIAQTICAGWFDEYGRQVVAVSKVMP